MVDVFYVEMFKQRSYFLKQRLHETNTARNNIKVYFFYRKYIRNIKGGYYVY